MSGKRHKKGLWLDPRAKLFLILICVLSSIRQKIEDDRAVPVYIRTISNLGYQFMPNISVKKDSL